MPELPEMKVLNIADKSFKVVDAAAQDHLLTHDQQIQQILDNDVVNENMLINSDFICNTYDDTDLNKSGWSFSATSETKPQLVGAMGLMILPPCTDVEIVTPIWHPAWQATQQVPSINFPITVSVEYAYNNLYPETLTVASVTYSDTTRTGELVNIAELEEGKYLQIKLTNGGTANVCRSLFTLSDQLTRPLYIRRIKIERSEIATGFPQSMKDLALLKEAKNIATNLIGDLLIVERKHETVSFDTYYKSIQIDVAKSGYTPIGTVGFQTNTVGALLFRNNLIDSTLWIGLVVRDGTSPVSGTVEVYVDVLYVKDMT